METSIVQLNSIDHIPAEQIKPLAESLISLTNFAGVATGRATHYNSLEEQREAERVLHKAVFDLDRGVYGLSMLLPGVTDYSKMRAVTALLGNRWNSKASIITREQENLILNKLVYSLPPQRVFKLFCQLRDKKVNNNRTRKVILSYILNSPNLELWAVKYRSKIRKSLEHAWGKRTTGIIKSIIRQPNWDNWGTEEISISSKYVGKYLEMKTPPEYLLEELLYFILGNTGRIFNSPLLSAFQNAKTDISAGAKLPKEVLEGLRSTYHKDVTQKQLLELIKGNLTTTQKRLVQKKAKTEGVEVEFDPRRYSLLELYIYAFEMGMTGEIFKAIQHKANAVAKSLPFKFKSVGIVLDDSYSMSGSEEQKLRPMALALGIKDVVSYSGRIPYILSVSGSRNFNPLGSLLKPKGATDLATSFVMILAKKPEAIFIISDGYENSPSGRVAEVLDIAERKGFCPTVYHINPVAAAESKKAMRQLSPNAKLLSVSKPEQLGLVMLSGLLETDPKQGVLGLLNLAVASLDKKKEK
jgi:hypothetical protein